MRLGVTLAMISGLAAHASAADVCNPPDLHGAYGFQLSGQTTISGDSKPVVTLGRLAFDGEGGLTGVSSVKYTGLLLGNPVTGTYETNTDCTVSWRLQDDSGAYQHFSGAAAPGYASVHFRQTDPGAPDGGLLVRAAADACDVSAIRPKYAFKLSGTMIPMTDGGSPSSVDAKGSMLLDSSHQFQLTIDSQPPYTTDVTIGVESDCWVDMEMNLAVEGDSSTKSMKFRGIVVDGYKQILAIQTDPGAVVSARFTAQ